MGEGGKERGGGEGRGGDPPFLFSPAPGFQGRGGDRLIRMFPERHCLALDARGHGRSSQLELPYHWRIFGRDLAAVAEHWDLQDAIGIGHSSGGDPTPPDPAPPPPPPPSPLPPSPPTFPP